MADKKKDLNLVSEEEIENQFSAGNWAPTNAEPIAPGQPIAGGAPIPSNNPGGQYGSGPLPPNFGYEPALVDTRYPASSGSIGLMPIQGGPGDNAKTIGVAKTIVDQAIASLPAAAAPVTQVTDGITHGQNNVTKGTWESDPAYVLLRDDFTGISGSTTFSSTPQKTGVGQLGWVLQGTPGGDGGNYGGVPPYIGQYAWDQGSSASTGGLLLLNSSGSETANPHIQSCWALGENPGWILTWIFKVDADAGATPAFTMAKKSFYIGLGGPTAQENGISSYSRPDVFMGLRYDTSTSAPSINDSFFTLEVVANPTTTSLVRNNTQGTTLVTNVAPIAGVWHRLDIYCNTAGKVTITLDGSAANTLTTSIPTFSFTTAAGGLTGSLSGNITSISWTASSTIPYSVWGAGSSVTISGFASPLSGTFTANYTKQAQLLYNQTNVNIGSTNVAGTVSGYPAFTPYVFGGNDDTSSPTGFTTMFFVDYFSFIWNPNLGPAAPGTPSAVLPRYF